VYKVKVNKNAVKEIQKLPKDIKVLVLRKIKKLSSIPRPRGVRKIVGEERLRRLRIRNYRLVYIIDDTAEEIEILYVRKREDAYK
jgi:mRNA interferase RelE/StbE